MGLDIGLVFLIGIAYLCLLFAIAWATDRGLVPEAVAAHPLVYTLSLGVFTGAWAFFGIVGVASHFGYGYLGFFVGTSVMFLFAPLLLMPLWGICQRFQLTSLADLLAFRFRGAPVGAIVTTGLLFAAMPLLVAQIEIVSGLASLITEDKTARYTRDSLGLVFACAIAVFAILFGVRTISEQERHNGLVVTMAFESLVKLACVLLLGAFALWQVHGGNDGLAAWLEAQPGLLERLHASLRTSQSHWLTLTFFASVLCLPDLFHMALYENPSPRAVFRASWCFPLYLLLLAVPVLPVLWAGERLGITDPIYFAGAAMGLHAGSTAVSLLAFVAGMSAASSMIVVTTLALASMTVNNLVLPFYRPGDLDDRYRRVALSRAIVTAVIILAAYLLSIGLRDTESIEKLGFAAFIAAAQFFPGTLALLYWPRANRVGLLGGLAVGFAIWLLGMIGPEAGAAVDTVLDALPFGSAGNPWASVAANSVILNALTLIALSYLSAQSREESEAAASCSFDNLSGAGRYQLQARSPRDFVTGLANVLGAESAQREVERALRDLDYTEAESRPYAMRRLRDRIEANLSRLVGASVAMELVNRSVPYAQETQAAEDITFVESRLEGYQRYLTGFMAELDGLRRFYRDTLQNLPLGVCGINTDDEIVMWNHALERITGIAADGVLGSALEKLADPWGSLILRFASSSASHLHHHRVCAHGEELYLSLHKTLGDEHAGQASDARFILLEDVTETQRLQDELVHTERLASIGRLAAGVAHEIGNPVTGIDFLAQNLLVESEEPTARDGAREILEQTKRISAIVQALVGFAHAGSGSSTARTPVAVAQCADEAIYLLGLDRNAPAVTYRNVCPPGHCVRADGQRLLQVFINLLSNARAASEPGGEIRIECEPHGNDSLITVTDDGSGIRAAHLDQVFEPFFTTKPPGEGTGLGLSLVYSIVRDMDGSVAVQSPADPARGRGTRVLITLPRAVAHRATGD